MNLTRYKYCISLLGLMAISISSPTAASPIDRINKSRINIKDQSASLLKQEAAQTIYLTKNIAAPNSQVRSREYTFKAPDSKIIKNSAQLTKNQAYKVEVYGNTVKLLRQVRGIEPRAFIKGEIIQVGIFGQQKNAEDLVRQLSGAGLWSRITVN